jgi:hypothetical protein
MTIEIFSRCVACIDFYLLRKNPFIWEISKSTKHMNVDAGNLQLKRH